MPVPLSSVAVSALPASLPAPEVSGPDLLYLCGGLGLLAAAVLPRLLRRTPLSAAMAFVGVGLLAGLLPIPLPDIDPVRDGEVAEHLTEVAVIVAVFGVGLSVDRKLSLPRWATTWRLLGIAMPLSIAVMAVLAWGVMGLVPAAALLLAAALAPTDPVLASDVQLEGPNAGEDDEVRFGLTSEAGLNDGLAFPFVYMAVFVAAGASFGEWSLRWLAWELVGKVAIGLAVGVAVGYAMAYVAFRSPVRGTRVAEAGEAIVALAAVFLAYGLAEVAQGYGFLAVFAAAIAGRQLERDHEYHDTLHQFTNQVERLFTLVLLLLFGVACARGLLDALTWQGAAVGVALVLLVRPLVGMVSLLGSRAPKDEQRAIAFFGVRGIGSFYYLAYASGEATFDRLEELWATVGFTVVLSVVVHGVLATPVMAALDRRRRPVVRKRGEHSPAQGMT